MLAKVVGPMLATMGSSMMQQPMEWLLVVATIAVAIATAIAIAAKEDVEESRPCLQSLLHLPVLPWLVGGLARTIPSISCQSMLCYFAHISIGTLAVL